MQTIVTKYHGATNTRSSRMSASAAKGIKPLSMPYNHGFDVAENHAMVAAAFKKRMGWDRPMVGGSLPNGDMAWVFTNDRHINPSHRKASEAGRTAYIRRKSQITKKPPVKRLKKRRAKNWDRPTKGRFPNPIPAKMTKADFQEEATFILDTLTGKLPLDSFNGQWDVFARYATMQSGSAKRAGFAEIADVMKAAANRAARKARKPAKNPAPRGFVIYAQGTGKRMSFDGTKFSERAPKIYGNARAAQGAGMHLVGKYPMLKKYRVWVGPYSPKA